MRRKHNKDLCFRVLSLFAKSWIWGASGVDLGDFRGSLGLPWDNWGDIFEDIGGSKVDAEQTSKKGSSNESRPTPANGVRGPKELTFQAPGADIALEALHYRAGGHRWRICDT